MNQLFLILPQWWFLPKELSVKLNKIYRLRKGNRKKYHDNSNNGNKWMEWHMLDRHGTMGECVGFEGHALDPCFYFSFTFSILACALSQLQHNKQKTRRSKVGWSTPKESVIVPLILNPIPNQGNPHFHFSANGSPSTHPLHNYIYFFCYFHHFSLQPNYHHHHHPLSAVHTQFNFLCFV